MQISTQQIKNAGSLLIEEDMAPHTILGTPPDFIAFNPPLKANVRIYTTDRDIVADGRLQMALGLTCARCLETFTRNLKAQFTQVFDPALETIDLTNDIREAVFVDLPLKAVCKENCQGLCPSCGQNKNLRACTCVRAQNPQFEPLRNFPFK